MEETFITQGIIVRRQKFRERDSRVAIYTPDRGKLELIVRGTANLQSKIAGHIEPFNLISLLAVRGRSWNYLGSGVAREVWGGIKENWRKTMVVGEGIYFFNQMVGWDLQDKEIYDLLFNFLELVNQKDIESIIVLQPQAFKFKLLACLGHKPELSYCSECKKIIKKFTKNNFSLPRSSLFCPDCISVEDNITLSEESVILLRTILKSDMFELTKEKIAKNISGECRNFIDYYIKYSFL